MSDLPLDQKILDLCVAYATACEKGGPVGASMHELRLATDELAELVADVRVLMRDQGKKPVVNEAARIFAKIGKLE